MGISLDPEAPDSVSDEVRWGSRQHGYRLCHDRRDGGDVDERAQSDEAEEECAEMEREEPCGLKPGMAVARAEGPMTSPAELVGRRGADRAGRRQGGPG